MVILPHASIGEVAISEGHQSRLTSLPEVVPFVAPTVVFTTLPTASGPHSNGLRNAKYVLLAGAGYMVARVFSRTPAERWRPVHSWLDRP